MQEAPPFGTPLRVHAAAPARFTHRLSILTLVWLRTGRILRRFVPILTWERSRGNGWEKATVQNDLLVAISQHLWAADIPGRSTDEPTRDDVLSQVQSQSVAVCSAPRARTLHAEKHARRPDDFSLACLLCLVLGLRKHRITKESQRLRFQDF